MKQLVTKFSFGMIVLTITSIGCMMSIDQVAAINASISSQSINNGKTHVVNTRQDDDQMTVSSDGTTEAPLRLTNLTLQLSNKSITAGLMLHNISDLPIDATVHVQLYDIIGVKSGDNEEQFAVLKKDDRRIDLELPTPFWGGIYRVVSHAHYADPNKLNDDSGKHNSVDGPSGWAVVTPQPFVLLLYSGLFIILIVGVVWLAKRRIKSRLHDKHTSE